MNDEQLFDIEIWLPFKGGEYHCTLAAGVNQAYVDKENAQYEEDLRKWRLAPSAWRLPFFHTLKVIPHVRDKNKSYIKTDESNKIYDEAREKGIIEGMKRVKSFITNQKMTQEFDKLIKDKSK
jgi:hypothetical protein